MNKYSLRAFTVLWLSMFVFSFLGFLYIILNLFFSEQITQSSLKDLKYNAYVVQLQLAEEREKMKNTLALHVTSPEFIGFLSRDNFDKAKILMFNWKNLLNIESVDFFDKSGVRIDLDTGEASSEGVVLSEEVQKKLKAGYEHINYLASANELVISIKRRIINTDFSLLGYLVETKKIPYQNLSEPGEGRDLIVRDSSGVVYASSGVLEAKRLSDKAFAKGAGAFELSIQGKVFDVFRLDVLPGISFFMVKTHLKTKVFKKFYQKYLAYFGVFIFFLSILFYLSYYLQVFRPLEQISKFIVEGGSEGKISIETSVSEISLIGRNIEERIVELHDDVEQTKKGRVEDMSRLVASVAHELNNSLSYLGGNLEYLKEEFLDETGELDREEMTEAISSAQSGYERIKKIVSDLRVFSSKRDLTVSWVSVMELKKMIAADFTGADISLPENFKNYEVEVDLERTFQIIKNLIVNAEQASDEKGVSRKILVSFYSEETGFVVSVKDWAGGISAELQKKIFEPFYTTKKNTGGAGLGLALSRSLAHEMSSTLVLDSTNSSGSTFCFKMKRFRSKS